MQITAGYEPTPQERVRAFQQALTAPRRKAWVLSAVLLSGGPLWILAGGDTLPGGWSFLVGLFLLAHLTWGTRLAARQQTPVPPGPTEVTVTEAGVTVRRPGHTTEIAWWAVRVVETADFVLLFHAPRLFTPILKRGFTPEQLAQVRGAAAAGRTVRPDARPVG
ncbi:YcxB family protein [Kitasatospora sp. NPDC085879]|jgi:hypothetical protein|uniref:YcxB family protein n=1 Tax=Kitasatospora sp. NPDC085879 TaxID=3154769 RepID=UPI003439BEAA